MFAVLKTGGKQYKVQAGDILRVEKLAAEAGETVQFNEILMVGATVGTPVVAGAGVQAEVIDQIKGEKVIHFVKRRRKHSSKRTKGHRQQLTLVKITEVLENGADKSGVKAAIGAGSVSGAAAPAAKPAAKKAEAAAGADDLTKINGVGPAAAKKLADAGITTFAQLAALDVDAFDAVKVKPEWVEQAKELA
ncbi:50S ribosomal protein L21 [Aliiroseovarius crassostreae]|uniref:50S ribosomal protein L21 n=1 Tax=Aliiroseovarius crassostreae TaxID=154981 RepID=UPI002207FEC7|nr:50S ribosomal protein L21 [Aliiroseovarius crassostreae]UWQ09491.1 50S ribosomal protein L21 [Aliiroseovarius crassostreae]UWQ12581.1 50S ribosomal protein L21 [Aliiroseovarius crassostreae]